MDDNIQQILDRHIARCVKVCEAKQRLFPATKKTIKRGMTFLVEDVIEELSGNVMEQVIKMRTMPRSTYIPDYVKCIASYGFNCGMFEKDQIYRVIREDGPFYQIRVGEYDIWALKHQFEEATEEHYYNMEE